MNSSQLWDHSPIALRTGIGDTPRTLLLLYVHFCRNGDQAQKDGGKARTSPIFCPFTHWESHPWCSLRQKLPPRKGDHARSTKEVTREIVTWLFISASRGGRWRGEAENELRRGINENRETCRRLQAFRAQGQMVPLTKTLSPKGLGRPSSPHSHRLTSLLGWEIGMGSEGS